MGTMATLTGHAVLAVGDYSTIMDNGPARAAGTAPKVQAAGEDIGDMFEITTWTLLVAQATCPTQPLEPQFPLFSPGFRKTRQHLGFSSALRCQSTALP